MSSEERKKDIECAVKVILERSLPNVDKFLLICLLRNGLRVSDICVPWNWHIIDKWSSRLISPKNGQTRIVNHCEGAIFAEDLMTAKALTYHQQNRYYYYRILKGLLPDYSSTRRSHRAVTHAARYIRAQEIFETSGDLALTAESIGNRTKRATAHYLSEEQKRLIIKKGVISTPSGSTEILTISKNGVIRLRK